MLHPITTAGHERRIKELCDWIAANCGDQPITWDTLTQQSGYSHRSLMTLFAVHVKMSPMTYVRRCRESKGLGGDKNPTGSLFPSQDAQDD